MGRRKRKQIGGLIVQKLTWKYVKPLHDNQAVTVFLQKNSVTLPEDLVDFLTSNNGGRPSEKLFNTDKGKGYVFKSLLSYNDEDKENIGKVYPRLFEGTTLYPIGSDASGNFVCYDMVSKQYILLKHETNSREIIELY